ncbi:MAG: metallophosphoesterase [Burkholderiaceae bacterium]
MTVRVAQVSDAHLCARRPFFMENFARVAEDVRASGAALVLATGDLTLGAGTDEDLAHGIARHAEIGPELRCVPGNHDVGNEPGIGRGEADAASVERWKRIAGPSVWVHDLPGWRLVGFDVQGLAFDPPAWDAIARAARDAGTRSVALVQHKPLCADSVNDAAPDYWSMFPAPRARLLALFGDARPALVISGHVHQWRQRRADGISQVWAPSTAFILGDPWQPSLGTKVIGWVEHAFHADGTHDARLRTVDGLRLDDLGRMPHVYRQLPTLDEKPDLWSVAR